jgi:hypothetical protein
MTTLKTRASYARDWKHYAEFCESIDVDPGSRQKHPETWVLERYFIEQRARGKKLASLERRRSGLQYIIQSMGHETVLIDIPAIKRFFDQVRSEEPKKVRDLGRIKNIFEWVKGELDSDPTLTEGEVSVSRHYLSVAEEMISK